jgi:hypothetical protein
LSISTLVLCILIRDEPLSLPPSSRAYRVRDATSRKVGVLTQEGAATIFPTPSATSTNSSEHLVEYHALRELAMTKLAASARVLLNITTASDVYSFRVVDTTGVKRFLTSIVGPVHKTLLLTFHEER